IGGTAQQLDRDGPVLVPVLEGEVLVAEEPVERVGQRDALELDAHLARIRLAADLRAAHAADLVEHLADGCLGEPHGEPVVLVADDPVGLALGRPREPGGEHDQRGDGSPPHAAKPSCGRPPLQSMPRHPWPPAPACWRARSAWRCWTVSASAGALSSRTRAMRAKRRATPAGYVGLRCRSPNRTSASVSPLKVLPTGSSRPVRSSRAARW